MTIIAVCFFLESRISKWIRNKVAGLQKNMKATDHPILPVGQALLVHGTNDEAAAALATAQFVSFGLCVAVTFVIIGLIFQAFDRASFFTGVYFDLSAESSPPGQWAVYKLYPVRDDAALPHTLRHSIYDHPALPKLIRDWMRTRTQTI